MLKLNPSPQFISPVSLTIAGESETGSVLLTFMHQGKQALAAWLDSATSGTSDLDLVAGVVLGWDGVNDESGAPVKREDLEIEDPDDSEDDDHDHSDHDHSDHDHSDHDHD